jgi:hypothetical protein
MTIRPSASLSPRAGMMVKTQAHAAGLRFALLVFARGCVMTQVLLAAPWLTSFFLAARTVAAARAHDDQGGGVVVRRAEPTRRRSQSGIALPGLRREEPEVAASMNCSIA